MTDTPPETSTTRTATWDAPAHDGGSPVTGYVLHNLTATGQHLTVETTGTSVVLSADMDVAGTFWVTAVNARGRGQASEPLAYTPNVAPVAAFTYSVNALDVDFDATGSTDQGAITYSWDFGDGSDDHPTTVTASHLYGEAGAYTITLTVTDAAGATAQATRTVTVTA